MNNIKILVLGIITAVLSAMSIFFITSRMSRPINLGLFDMDILILQMNLGIIVTFSLGNLVKSVPVIEEFILSQGEPQRRVKTSLFLLFTIGIFPLTALLTYFRYTGSMQDTLYQDIIKTVAFGFATIMPTIIESTVKDLLKIKKNKDTHEKEDEKDK